MKPITLLFLLCILSNLAHAQNEQFQKGQIDLQAGVGLLSVLNLTINSAGASSAAKFKNTSLPLFITGDYGITDALSIGGYIGVAKLKLIISGEEAERDNITIIAVRGLYHFDLSPKFDTYGGGMLGVTHLKSSTTYFGSPSSGSSNYLGYQITVGGRYRLTSHIGTFAELGYGISILNLGINVKL